MKIIYIHQYFRTPQEGGPIRSYYLAKGLVDHGFEVEMITSHSKKEKVVKDVDGIKVHYLPAPYSNLMSFKRRIISFLKFMYLAVDEVSKIKNVDLCYATSTPLTVGSAAIKIKEKVGIPYIFEVRDLWPEAPAQMGALTNPWLLRYAEDLEQRIYNEAEKIVALSPGIHSGIQKKSGSKSISMIPNMSDISFFERQEKDHLLEARFDTSNKFVVSYFGAIGRANKLDYFLEAARESLKSKIPVKFLIVGEGSERARLEDLSKKGEITNIEFLPFMNKSELKEMLNITDAAYISFDNKPILETNSPNKFFDALASGKMVITNTKGWLQDLSEKHNCGFYTNPQRPDEFVKKLIPFLEDKGKLSEVQINARKLGENTFSRKQQVDALISTITA
jgi:glycosyltransferase involved in cell wall biosynthesis